MKKYFAIAIVLAVTGFAVYFFKQPPSPSVEDGTTHADHSPKHGGQFFMAPDQFHHLEGVLRGREFRLYLYDDYTRPIAAAPFLQGSRLQVDLENPLVIPLSVSKESEYLQATLPKGLKPPVELSLWLKLPHTINPELFNFIFE